MADTHTDKIDVYVMGMFATAMMMADDDFYKKIFMTGGKGECVYHITHNSITPVDEDGFFTFAVNIRNDFAIKYLKFPECGMKCDCCDEIMKTEEERIAYIHRIHRVIEEGEAKEKENSKPKKKVVRKKKKGGKK